MTAKAYLSAREKTIHHRIEQSDLSNVDQQRDPNCTGQSESTSKKSLNLSLGNDGSQDGLMSIALFHHNIFRTECCCTEYT